jgi:hypothetical protein
MDCSLTDPLNGTRSLRAPFNGAKHDPSKNCISNGTWPYPASPLSKHARMDVDESEDFVKEDENLCD